MRTKIYLLLPSKHTHTQSRMFSFPLLLSLYWSFIKQYFYQHLFVTLLIMIKSRHISSSQTFSIVWARRFSTLTILARSPTWDSKARNRLQISLEKTNGTFYNGLEAETLIHADKQVRDAMISKEKREKRGQFYCTLIFCCIICKTNESQKWKYHGSILCKKQTKQKTKTKRKQPKKCVRSLHNHCRAKAAICSAFRNS